MKIGILHFGKKGAGPVYSLEMARALNKLGHEIYFYASNNIENKIVIESQNFNIRFFKTYNSKLEYLSSIIFKNKIRNVINSIYADNLDIIYSPMNDLWLPFIFPKLKNILRIKTIHDVEIHRGNNSLFNKWWNKSNFKDADKFIILSKLFINHLTKLGIRINNICVIPHAGFNYYLDVMKETNNKIIDNCDFMFFGRIDEYKGIDVLLDSMPFIISKFPNLRIGLVGNGNLNPYMNKINKYKNNFLIINKWIRDEEIGNIIPNAKFLVLPYTHATQSGVIPLAYAFSKPVIVTNTGGLPEQVINNQTGILIEKNSPKQLADAILNMLSNPKLIEDMGSHANKFMKENLTWESSAKKFIHFIEE